MVFGVVNSNVLSLMCDFLVLMLPLTDTPVVTESTSYFNQLFSVSGVLAPAVDTRPNFRLQQWTWSYQNLSLFSFLLPSKFVSPFVYMTISLLWVLNLYFAFVCTLPSAVIIKSFSPWSVMVRSCHVCVNLSRLCSGFLPCRSCALAVALQ